MRSPLLYCSYPAPISTSHTEAGATPARGGTAAGRDAAGTEASTGAALGRACRYAADPTANTTTSAARPIIRRPAARNSVSAAATRVTRVLRCAAGAKASAGSAADSARRCSKLAQR